MGKVLISGGGRCNVTNTISDPKQLVKNYPRGFDKLQPCFERFSSDDTQQWFEDRGVRLKTESDGRVFPVSDDSSSIADTLQREAHRLKVKINYKTRAVGFEPQGDQWLIKTNLNDVVADLLVIATGGSPAIWKALEKLDLNIVAPVPSLFTFHAKHKLLEDLAGISFPNATVKILTTKTDQSGPILITHEGISGPAVLKLSAWAARELHELNYKCVIRVNWLGIDAKQLKAAIVNEQETNPKKHVINRPVMDIPKRFWQRVCELSDITKNRNYAEIGKKQIAKLTELLLNCDLTISGKSTNKDEFVTAGGVDLDEIDFDTFAVKKYKNLFMAGEVLNIDAVTGGFNFQAAWTGGWIIGKQVVG